MQRTEISNTNIRQRRTVRNLFRLITSGQIIEILKVLRRRTLNSLKVAKRGFWILWGTVYYHPIVQKRRLESQLRHILSKYYSYPNNKNGKNILRIALVIREGTTYPKSSAFIRLIGPLTQDEVSDKLTIKILPENTTSVAPDTNICIVQRNAFDAIPIAEKFVRNLRSMGSILIVDSDDAFHSIDTHHPEHDVHCKRLEAFKYLVTEADQVWLSTPRLLSSINETEIPAVVIDNSLDKRIWKADKKTGLHLNKSKPLQMLYMGTVSHDADLKMIYPVLDRLAKKYPGSFRLTVMGVTNSPPDNTWLKRVYQKRNGSIYPRFVQWFIKQGSFDIGLSPLVDTKFNNCKSDIKCLDYLAAGILPVVSDVEPYSSTELDDYIIRVKNTSDDWEKKLSDIVLNPGVWRNRIAQIIPKAQKYIWDNRSSKATAKIMLKHLESLRTKS